MKNIIKPSLAILVFVIINLLAGTRLFHQGKELKFRHPPVSIEIIRNGPSYMAGTIDVDDDEEDEVVFSLRASFPNKQHILIFEFSVNVYNQEYYGDILVPKDYTFFDMYYHPVMQTYIFRFLEVENGELFLREVDNRQNLIKNMPFERQDHPMAWKGNWCKKPSLVDLDGDKKKELVILLQSDYPLDPRGVVCHDPETGKRLWEYFCGPQADNIEFHDLDHDGKKEIILTTFAANNNIERNGTGDRYSYVIVLDYNGRERWKQVTGDWQTNSHAVVSDLDNDGKPEIFAAAERQPDLQWNREKIFIFNALTGELKHSFPAPPSNGISFTKPYVLKSGNKEARLYVGDTGGGLWMLDKSLKPLEKIEKKGPLYVLNTTAPGENWNYLYVRSQNQLLVFDLNLGKEIYTRNFELPFEFLPFRLKQGYSGVIKAEKLYRLKETTAAPTPIFKQFPGSGFLLTFIVMLLCNGFFIYLLSGNDWQILRRLRRKTGAEQPLETSQLHDIVQAIAHQVKNPISTILWTAEKIKRDSKTIDRPKTRDTFIQMAGFLEEDVKTLKQYTRQISKLVQVYTKPPAFREINLKTILEQAVEDFRHMREGGKTINLHLKIREETRDIILTGDEELLKEALLNLLGLVFASLPGERTIVVAAAPLTSLLKRKLNKVCIRITLSPGETSAGKPASAAVSAENHAGLFIGKRIVALHDGTIRESRRKGFGTKIAIILPVR